MRAYVVRLKRDAELVGIFVSPSAEQLWDFVDECTNPFVCEYVALPPGGVYWSQAGAAKVPTLISDPEDDSLYPDFFTGGTISELWMDIFYGSGKVKWTSIEFPEGGLGSSYTKTL